MKCPFCGHEDTKVIDSRPAESSIRRRRECIKCGRRFTTYEKVETIPVMVIKKNRTREPFDRRKIEQGVLRATSKRPISVSEVEKLVDGVENQVLSGDIKEIRSTDIGEIIMQKLLALDEVAYIRFAAVYKEFADLDTFIREIERIAKEKNG